MSAVANYFEHINGQWIAENPIPDDQVRWGSFMILRNENLERVKHLCESSDSHISKLYTTYNFLPMTISPYITDLLKQVDSITNVSDCFELLGKLCKSQIFPFFIIDSLQDAKEPEMVVPGIFQSGLGLPDMSYYSERVDTHDKYKSYITDLMKLYGLTIDANTLFNFESRIATLHFTRTEQRDADLRYNKMQYKQLYELIPEIYDELGIDMQYVIVQNVKLLTNLRELLTTTPIEIVKDYMKFDIANTFSSHASVETDALHFEFYDKYLNGRKVQEPRWKRAVQFIQGAMQDDMSKLYEAVYFPKEKSAVCKEMIDDIRDTLADMLKNSVWMSEETKAVAAEKLARFNVKIGAPEVPEPCCSEFEDTTDFIVHLNTLKNWNWRKTCAEFYKPVNKNRWEMCAATVNAYFHPTLNEIVFPAGILQKPFFGFDTYEENIGAIGVVIGHEMTHGYDDEGSKYNQFGELKEWWSDADCAEFSSRAKVVEEHYSSKTFRGKPVNGKLTLGENIADIGGLKIALRALKTHYGNFITPDIYKRFFTAYATVWRQNITDECAHQFLVTDPHSPTELRVNCALAHIPEFYTTYNVKEGDGMYLAPEKRMSIW